MFAGLLSRREVITEIETSPIVEETPIPTEELSRVEWLLEFWAEGGELGNGRYPLTIQSRPNSACMIRRKTPAT